jgi:uncharacterized protein (TIGR02147 family)
MSFDIESQELLFEKTNYRIFFEEALRLKKMQNPHFSNTLFVMKAGLSSRSFPGDVIRGKKNITLRSIPKVMHALGLTGVLSKYFTLLVELEHPSLRVTAKTDQALQKELLNLRVKFKNKVQRPKAQIEGEMFNQFHRSLVYAALGTPELGATFKEVLQKTKLESKICKRELETLVRIGAADFQRSGDRKYRATQSHLVFADMQGHHNFQKHILSALQEAQKHAYNGIKRETELFFHSVLSINQRDSEKLKLALREILTDFVGSSEVAEGDSLSHLICTFFEV